MPDEVLGKKILGYTEVAEKALDAFWDRTLRRAGEDHLLVLKSTSEEAVAAERFDLLIGRKDDPALNRPIPRFREKATAAYREFWNRRAEGLENVALSLLRQEDGGYYNEERALVLGALAALKRGVHINNTRMIGIFRERGYSRLKLSQRSNTSDESWGNVVYVGEEPRIALDGIATVEGHESGNIAEKVVILDASNGRQLREFNVSGEVQQLDASIEPALLAIAVGGRKDGSEADTAMPPESDSSPRSGSVLLVDPSNGKILLDQPLTGANRVAITEDASVLVATRESVFEDTPTAIVIRRNPTSRFVAQALTTFTGSLGVAVSPDGKLAAVGEYASLRKRPEVKLNVQIWSTDSCELVTRLPVNDSVQNLSFDELGKRLAIPSLHTGVGSIWDLENKKELVQFQHSALDAEFSPDGRLLASGGGATARVFDSESGGELLRLQVYYRDSAPILSGPGSIALSPSGHDLATRVAGLLCVWDITRLDADPKQLEDEELSLSPRELWNRWQIKFGLTVDENDQVIPLWPHGPWEPEGPDTTIP